MAERNDSQTEARDILRRVEPLRAERRKFEATWEEVADHAGSQWGGFNVDPQHPREQPVHILDSTLAQSAETLAAGLSSGACGPNQRWFGTSMEDEELNRWAERRRSGAEKAWLQAVEDNYYRMLSRGGYYQQTNIAFWQWGLFGWHDLMLDEDLVEGPRFSARALPEVWIGQDFRGRVNRAVREFEMTAAEIAAEFGRDGLPESVRRALESPAQNPAQGRDKSFRISHVILPRDGDGPDLRAHQRFASWYILREGGEKGAVLDQGGYRSFPHLVARCFRLPKTPYSYSPGMNALPNSRMANEMLRLLLEAGQLSVAPPYLIPDDSVVGNITFQSYGLNYYRKDNSATAQDFQPLAVGGDPRFDLELLRATQQDIGALFKTPLFNMVNQRIQAGAAPTATEVQELAGERMFLLTPLLVAIQTEIFDPMFDLLWEMMIARGEVPPVPRELVGRRFRVVYKSPLMRAQQEFRSQAVLKTAQQSAALAQMDQGVMDLFKWDEAARVLADQNGFPAEAMRSPEELRALAEVRQRALASSQMQALAGQAMDRYGDLSSTPEQGSPADLIVKSFQGGVAA